MKRVLLLVLVLLLLVLALASCGGGSGDAVSKVSSSPQTYTLYAGQNTAVGEIQVWDDATNLYVNYHMYSAEWALTETHLDVVVGDTGDGIPQKNGNPIPGKFDYKTNHNYVLDYLYTIPLSDLGVSAGDDVSIAAHASAQQASQLLLNEGFEQPYIGDGVYWAILNDANDEVPNWDVTWTYDGTPGNLEYWFLNNDYNYTFGAPEGLQTVEMCSDSGGGNGYPGGSANVKISQDVSGLTNNCFLSFYWRPRNTNQDGNGNYDCEFVANFNGADLGTFNASNFSPNSEGYDDQGNSRGINWDHEVIPLDTTGITDANLYFEETGVNNGGGNLGSLLDGISILAYGNGETAWSEGVPFSGSNWATFSVYEIGTGTN